MLIFDDFERTYLGPAENAEGQFEYLNRSARPEWARVRAVMETWFADYPFEHRNDLVGRIRDDSDAQHNSAYFELFLYTVFSRLGFAITVHPDSPTGKGNPDFLMKSEDTLPFHLEAKVVTGESERDMKDRKFREEIEDSINQIKTQDFFVSFRLVNGLTTQPPLEKIRSVVLNYINSLDRSEVESSVNSGNLRQFEKKCTVQGWDFIISPLPRHDNDTLYQRIIGVSSRGFFPVTDIQDIQSAVKNKAKRYGDLSTPYLIAINMMSYGAGFSDFISALFGEYEDHPSRGDGTLPGLTTRSPNAALRWRGKPRNTRVSAVIGFHHALPWHIPDLYVCPNPWAKYPLAQPLPRLSRFDLMDDRFVPVAGDPLKEILGLPPNWPDE